MHYRRRVVSYEVYRAWSKPWHDYMITHPYGYGVSSNPGELGSVKKVIRVGDIWVDLAIDAPVPEGPYERCHFASFWIEGNYYIVTVNPPLTLEDLLKIIESMKPSREVLE